MVPVEDAFRQTVLSALASPAPHGADLKGVSDLRCPEERPTAAGSLMTCTVKIDGDITVLNLEMQGPGKGFSFQLPS